MCVLKDLLVVDFTVRQEASAAAERLQQDLTSERMLRETLQTKLASQDSKNESEEVSRLNAEIEKLNARYAEMMESEEKKRAQTVEYWQVEL